LRIDASGVELPDLAFYVPSIPRLPVAEIPLALTFGRVESVLVGVVGSVARDIPFPHAAVPAELMLSIDRPSARTILDLIPTRVEFSLPLDGGAFEVDASHPLDPAATGGGPLAIRAPWRSTRKA
jgi:hypothetical protein